MVLTHTASCIETPFPRLNSAGPCRRPPERVYRLDSARIRLPWHNADGGNKRCRTKSSFFSSYCWVGIDGFAHKNWCERCSNPV